MTLSAFDGAAHPPRESELREVLGPAAATWLGLIAYVRETHPPSVELWHHGGAEFGWNLRLKRKKRIIAYLTPQAGGFLVGLVLGEKAVERARAGGLAEPIQALVDAAPRYAEGRGLRMPIETLEDLLGAERLIDAKMAG
jgi:hypothetical protein